MLAMTSVFPTRWSNGDEGPGKDEARPAHAPLLPSVGDPGAGAADEGFLYSFLLLFEVAGAEALSAEEGRWGGTRWKRGCRRSVRVLRL